MAIAWPHVIDYLREQLPQVDGWAAVAVFDGPPVTGDDPTDYATVGTPDDDSAGSFTQTWNEDGFHVNEEGGVRVELTCQTGDDDAAADVRLRAFGLVDALDVWLRKNQTLGGLLSQNATVLLASDGLRTVAGRGTAQVVSLTVGYYTETFAA